MIAMEVPEYRRRYEAELAKAAPPKARRRAAKRALTAAKPPSAAARAKAIAAAPLEEESLPEQVAELLATSRNRQGSLRPGTARPWTEAPQGRVGVRSEGDPVSRL